MLESKVGIASSLRTFDTNHAENQRPNHNLETVKRDDSPRPIGRVIAQVRQLKFNPEVDTKLDDIHVRIHVGRKFCMNRQL